MGPYRTSVGLFRSVLMEQTPISKPTLLLHILKTISPLGATIPFRL